MICALVLTATIGQIDRPLPKYVQEMSQEEYETWAIWQNHHAANYREESAEPKYLSMLKTTTSGSTVQSGRNHSSSSTKNGKRRNVGGRGGVRRLNIVTTSRTKRYRNPYYITPRGVRVYNPFVKPVGGRGTPDWGRLFVPTKEGVLPMSKVIPDRPIPLEQLYRQLMRGK